MDLCCAARKRGARAVNNMLCVAASYGRAAFCAKAIKWGADDADTLLVYGALRKDTALCDMARRMAARPAIVRCMRALLRCAPLSAIRQESYDAVLAIAALRGDMDMCRIARGWGAHNFLCMFRNAAMNGQPATAALALEWLREDA